LSQLLLLLSGWDCCREEIEATAFQLQDRLEQMETSNKDLSPLLVLPLYSELPGERQALIFDAAPPGARKCVIATNIAETSLTIDGIKYVIDCGYCKFKVFSPKMGMDSLQARPASSLLHHFDFGSCIESASPVQATMSEASCTAFSECSLHH
jgi:HrpA-like RNA helicase